MHLKFCTSEGENSTHASSLLGKFASRTACLTSPGPLRDSEALPFLFAYICFYLAK